MPDLEPFFSCADVQKALDRECVDREARRGGRDPFADLATRLQRIDRKLDVVSVLAYISSLLAFGIPVLVFSL